MRYALLLFALLIPIACASSTPRAVSAVAGLPEYSPEEASLFDDKLMPGVFGLPTEIPAERDPKLPERAQGADAVVRVKVATVSEQLLAGTRGFTLVLSVEPGPLRGTPPESPLELQLGRGSPSLVMVEAEASTLVGRRFILFLKHYSHRGERELHWHGEGDTPALEETIERGKPLDELSTTPHTRD